MAVTACVVGLAGLAASPLTPADASTLDAFNTGDVIVDFQFNDANGTTIPSTVNTGSAGGSFDNDTDSANVVTNGLGQLDATGKNNTSFGSNYVDVDDVTEGRIVGLFEVSWDFDESVYDSGQDEEFRLSLINRDPRSTFVTAEIYFQRTSATEVTLFGNAVGTGATDTVDTLFGSSGSLLTLIDLDLDAGDYELLYSADGGTTFLSAGGGSLGLDPDDASAFRSLASVRLVLNEDFSDDTVLIDRFAVSVVIPEPSTVGLFAVGLIGFTLRRRRHAA
ncbi:MAG: PEP-CTERM sorting domain-containing protein [Planctomycetota bacterium]